MNFQPWWWEIQLIQLQTIWEGKRRCLWGTWHLNSISLPKFQTHFLRKAFWTHCYYWVALPIQWILKWVKLSVRIIVCRIKMPFLNVSLYTPGIHNAFHKIPSRFCSLFLFQLQLHILRWRSFFASIPLS